VASRCTTASRLAAGVRIFLQKILQSNIVEHGISKEPLQLGVLVFQALQALRLRNIHAPELRLPGIERRRADPVLAAKISRRNPRLLLAQNRHDLFLCKPRSLHRPVLPSIRTLASSGGLCGGHSNPYIAAHITQSCVRTNPPPHSRSCIAQLTCPHPIA